MVTGTQSLFDSGDLGPEALLRLFLGSSHAARTVRKSIRRFARVSSTVLIRGDSGVGKELVAREIHARSPRQSGPFVPVNCAALPETLVDSALFGHEQGAFTDARKLHRGAFEQSHLGTLFLDEIGDLSPLAQPKLLRVLESGEVLRVGGERAHHLDLRIIAATNHELEAMCHDESFRWDLYYRLGVLTLHVPPLHERLDDVGELVRHFATDLSRKLHLGTIEVSDSAVEYLKGCAWPGNVRQLRSAVERALSLNSERVLDVGSFEAEPSSLAPPGLDGMLDHDWRTAHEEFDRVYADALLRRHDGKVEDAARAAGLAVGSLYKILRRLGMRRPGSPPAD